MLSSRREGLAFEGVSTADEERHQAYIACVDRYRVDPCALCTLAGLGWSMCSTYCSDRTNGHRCSMRQPALPSTPVVECHGPWRNSQSPHGWRAFCMHVRTLLQMSENFCAGRKPIAALQRCATSLEPWNVVCSDTVWRIATSCH